MKMPAALEKCSEQLQHTLESAGALVGATSRAVGFSVAVAFSVSSELPQATGQETKIEEAVSKTRNFTGPIVFPNGATATFKFKTTNGRSGELTLGANSSSATHPGLGTLTKKTDEDGTYYLFVPEDEGTITWEAVGGNPRTHPDILEGRAWLKERVPGLDTSHEYYDDFNASYTPVYSTTVDGELTELEEIAALNQLKHITVAYSALLEAEELLDALTAVSVSDVDTLKAVGEDIAQLKQAIESSSAAFAALATYQNKEQYIDELSYMAERLLVIEDALRVTVTENWLDSVLGCDLYDQQSHTDALVEHAQELGLELQTFCYRDLDNYLRLLHDARTQVAHERMAVDELSGITRLVSPHVQGFMQTRPAQLGEYEASISALIINAKHLAQSGQAQKNDRLFALRKAQETPDEWITLPSDSRTVYYYDSITKRCFQSHRFKELKEFNGDTYAWHEGATRPQHVPSPHEFYATNRQQRLQEYKDAYPTHQLESFRTEKQKDPLLTEAQYCSRVKAMIDGNRDCYAEFMFLYCDPYQPDSAIRAQMPEAVRLQLWQMGRKLFGIDEAETDIEQCYDFDVQSDNPYQVRQRVCKRKPIQKLALSLKITREILEYYPPEAVSADLGTLRIYRDWRNQGLRSGGYRQGTTLGIESATVALHHELGHLFGGNDHILQQRWRTSFNHKYSTATSLSAIGSNKAFELRPQNFAHAYGYYGGMQEDIATVVEMMHKYPYLMEAWAEQEPVLAQKMQLVREMYQRTDPRMNDKYWEMVKAKEPMFAQ